MHPNILGLTGPAGAGKDTVATLIETASSVGNVHVMAFADALYQEVATAYGVTVEWLKDRSRKEVPQHELALIYCTDLNFSYSDAVPARYLRNRKAPLSPRQVLRWWGTEYRRAQDPDYWVKRAAATIDQLPASVRQVVITDVRFPNEAQLIRERQGRIWQILRPGCEATGQHVSDVSGQEFQPDIQLHNDRDLQALASTVQQLLPTLDPLPMCLGCSGRHQPLPDGGLPCGH